MLDATDNAARGIDVDGVSHVINFELPNVPEDFSRPEAALKSPPIPITYD